MYDITSGARPKVDHVHTHQQRAKIATGSTVRGGKHEGSLDRTYPPCENAQGFRVPSFMAGGAHEA